MLSKALVVGAYQRKLEALAALPDVELACVVPPAWGGQTLERAFLAGYRLVVRPIRFNGNFHLFHFRGLGQLIGAFRPDVVHVDEEPYNLATLLATREAVRAGARPIFFTWQNLDRGYPPPFSWIERYVYRHTPHAIAGNGEAEDVLRRKGYRGDVSVIPQFGVDPELFKPGERPNASGRFRIGFAGRLIEEKGLFVLLDAVHRLRGDWQLRLFGSGPLRGAFSERVGALGLADRVTMEGAVASTEMPGRLAELDALVLPSLTRPNWKEQFGRILVEAMACAVAVVGSDSGEIPRVVGDAGLVVPEGDADALRSALEKLLTDRPLRLGLGRRGRARVLDRFTHERIAGQTAAVYRAVAAQAATVAAEPR
jgi:glycosyltransferase involved in cell wall biosynthesis